MNKFDEWWKGIEHSLIATGRDNPHILAALKAVANGAWDAACEQITQRMPEEATCYCGDIYSPDVNLNACVVIQETGHCPNCIAMGMREYKK